MESDEAVSGQRKIKIVSYEPGDDVFKEEPFAYIIKPDYRSYVCDFCIKRYESTDDLKKCTKCKFVHYCNVECHKKAWKSHKHECKLIEALIDNIEPEMKEVFLGVGNKSYRHVFLFTLKIS